MKALVNSHKWYSKPCGSFIAYFVNSLLAAILMLSGIIVNAQNRETEALISAVEKGQLEKVKTLLTSGVNLEGKDRYGQTSLMIAVHKRNLPMIKMLLSAGANVNARSSNSSPRTPLMYALNKTEDEISNPKDFSPPWDRNRRAILMVLLHAKSNVNVKDTKGRTPLMVAAAHGYVKAIKTLLAAGARLNAKDNDGNTALLICIKAGYPDSARALISYGINVNARNKDGETALMRAAYSELTGFGDPDCEHCDAEIDNCYPEIAKRLIEAGALVNARDKNGNTALLNTAISRNGEAVKVAKILLAASAKINLHSSTGDTALTIAATWGSIDMMRVLLQAGAKINLQGSTGDTALMRVAALWGEIDKVKLLLQAGADINLANKLGETALMFAQKLPGKDGDGRTEKIDLLTPKKSAKLV